MDKGTLDCIYAAAADDEALDHALRRTARACRARAAGLFRIVDGRLDWERSIDMPPRFMHDYIETVGADDPRTEILQRYPPQTILSDAQPNVRRAMQNSGVAGFVAGYDLPYTAGTHLLRGRRHLWNLYISRSRRQGPPDDAELAAFEHLVPHFSRCLKLRLAHKALQQRLQCDSNHSGTTGRILRDRKGRVRWMDAGADSVFARTDFFRIEGGRIACRHARGQAWLERAAAAVSNRRGHVRVPPELTLLLRNPAGRMTLRMLPFGKQDDLDPVLAQQAVNWHAIIIEWLPRSARRHSTAAVALTPRQWEVLSLLALGYDTSQVADRLGCARSTARNHSQALLARFGASGRIQMLERARRLGMID